MSPGILRFIEPIHNDTSKALPALVDTSKSGLVGKDRGFT